jgi:mannose-6-phosphate isomerase-like protein (cupin superfamily)
LSGEAVMGVDDRQVRLTAGEGIHVAPGVRHQIRNVSQEPVRFLVISQPPSHGDRVIVEAR